MSCARFHSDDFMFADGLGGGDHTEHPDRSLIRSEHGADILVSDVVMPVLDGFELCRIIRRDPILRDLPILLITGEGDRRHMERESARAGANSVLAKPFNARRLCDRIELLLRSRSPPPTDEASEDHRTDPDPHDGENSTQEES